MAVMLPSLDDFHGEILTWDYFNIRPNVAFYRVKQVPTRFSSPADYLTVMDPLLFEEVRASILRAREERGIERSQFSTDHTRETRVVEAGFTRNALNITLTMELVHKDEGDWIIQGDLVLVTKDGPADRDQRWHSLGVVDRERREDDFGNGSSTHQWQIRVAGGGTDRGDGVHMSSDDGREILGYSAVPGTTWYVTKMCSLVTAQREYQALRSLEHLPATILHTVLKSAPMPSMRRPLRLSSDLEENMKREYNPSQWMALSAALRNAITLVQGPPGTGKTKTILGLLSVLLNSTADGSTQSKCANRATEEEADSGKPSKQLHIPSILLPEGKETQPVKAEKEKESIWRQASPWEGKKTEEREVRHGGLFDLKGREEAKTVRRMLVCAPSNAAIDEIAIRVIDLGLPGSSLQESNLEGKIVRVGPNVHPRLQHISLPTLVGKRLSEQGTADENTASGQEMTKESVRKAILAEATIVFCTLSSSGTPVFSQLSVGFDTVIVDEAAQAVEVSTLIPIKYGCERLIMVGDVAQLPATVLSRVAINHGYDISLFRRLQQCGYPVWFLQTQYRMHPAISEYPAKCFYLNKLVNAEELVRKSLKPIPEQQTFYELECFGPYVFYDVQGTKETESQTTKSWRNLDEVKVIVRLYQELRKRYPQIDPSTVGIITPYKGQVSEFRKAFQSLGSPDSREIDVNTIDGFQGREKDIVFFSCVRARKQHGVGFLADERRMNVALTRARFALWIVGSAKTLVTNVHWRNVIQNAQERGCYTRIVKPIDQALSKVLAHGLDKSMDFINKRRRSANADGEREIRGKRHRGVERDSQKKKSGAAFADRACDADALLGQPTFMDELQSTELDVLAGAQPTTSSKELMEFAGSEKLCTNSSNGTTEDNGGDSLGVLQAVKVEILPLDIPDDVG